MPLFDQLRVGVIDAVRDGRLERGTRLPTVRDMAAELGLAPNTVARAYRELEGAGVIETRGRHGTFVARSDPADAAMAAAAHAYAETARSLGLGESAATSYLHAEFAANLAGVQPNSNRAQPNSKRAQPNSKRA